MQQIDTKETQDMAWLFGKDDPFVKETEKFSY